MKVRNKSGLELKKLLFSYIFRALFCQTSFVTVCVTRDRDWLWYKAAGEKGAEAIPLSIVEHVFPRERCTRANLKIAVANNYERGLSVNSGFLQNWYQIKVREKSFLGQVLRKFRRSYHGYFDPGYIERAVEETRKGDCHRCGLCCQLIYRCPMLGRDSQNLPYCRAYGDLRPANCRNYPYDKTDSEIDRCGYHFE